MRILWVKMNGLWPATTGGRVRSLQIVSALARQHEVTLLTTHGPGDDPDGLTRRLAHCRDVVSLPFVPPKKGDITFPLAVAKSWLSRDPVDLRKWRFEEVARRVRQLMTDGSVDVCVADFLFAAVNVPFDTPTPVVLFEHNVEYVIWQRLAALERNPLKRALFAMEWRKMRAREAALCRAASLTIAVSDEDARRLAGLSPGARTVSIPTGVDTEYFAPLGTPERPARLVFSGSMDWQPNEDAVAYFADAILPRLRADVPDITLSVVGRNPSPRLRSIAERAGLVVSGTVDDVRPWIDEAPVYVVPLRAGGGTRLKIFEALAMAKAVVSTTVGAEGLALTHGEHFIAADDPETFAAAILQLLRDPERRQALGRAGRALVEEHFSWGQIAREFEAHCRQATTPHRPPTPLRICKGVGSQTTDARPRAVLICHEEDRLDMEGLTSWLAHTMQLAGLIVIRNNRRRLLRAARREMRRVGVVGFLDMMAFRLYARLFLSAGNRAWTDAEVARLRRAYPAEIQDVLRIVVDTPNSAAAREFLERIRPDLAIARCKFILRPDIFRIPRAGTFVFHPGICPEYRNAHGCFWALAQRDVDRVGMTLLKVDAGIDTGEVYLQAGCTIDEARESHHVIQSRVVSENLGPIGRILTAIANGETPEPVATAGRRSATWGQPSLTAYLRWKWAARRRRPAAAPAGKAPASGAPSGALR